MKHAMIIGSSGPTANALTDGLWSAGYLSIIRVGNTAEALSILRCVHPDLILLLPDASQFSPSALQLISEEAGVPIIVATNRVGQARRSLGPKVSLDGPYGLQDLGELHKVPVSRVRQLLHAT